MQLPIDIHPEVREALHTGGAVVALESTIISHGMPFPQNLQTARGVEEVVRAQGAVPATIGIVNGRIRIGLGGAELESFAQARDVAKVSRRDLPYVVASGRTGATTVAATMICAKLAGIAVFVTGGIGGVHRDGHVTLDVSADLLELAHTSVAVVCAGAKAILDLPRTLEVLETHGVPVVGFGTDEFPAFYTRQSGLGVDVRVDTPEEAARLLRTKWALGLEGGVLFANPVPAEHALDPQETTRVIETSLEEAKRDGVRGKAVTPYLLAKIVEHTGGRSLQANIALVRHNAMVGAQIAKAYATQRADAGG